jgi:hypothetical protein
VIRAILPRFKCFFKVSGGDRKMGSVLGEFHDMHARSQNYLQSRNLDNDLTLDKEIVHHGFSVQVTRIGDTGT